jgi:hypothetical protein
MWLHSPTRLAGWTLLIMLAVLLAALVEHQVRRWIARTGALLHGLLPEGHDTPFPTAKMLLRTFRDYAGLRPGRAVPAEWHRGGALSPTPSRSGADVVHHGLGTPTSLTSLVRERKISQD